MTIESALEYIKSLEVFGSKPGLGRISELLGLLGAPARPPEYIHVAGTNGKGSVSVMLAEIFRRAGYKTGLTVSPFVLDFRERIQINGGMISPEDLSRETEKLRALARKMSESITEFEFITALALDYFNVQGCDIAVLETGLGGRFDATNIIPRNHAAVITSISLDHTRILGDTAEQIAFEKCGIFKPGGTAVSYPVQPPGVLEVIQKSAAGSGNQLIIPDLAELSVISENITGSTFVYKGQEYRTGMPGRHQVYNAVTAVEAAVSAGGEAFPGVGCGEIRDGISSARLPARIEVIRENPLLILDGAHNPDGARALRSTLGAYLPGEKAVYIIGMLRDKDFEQVLEILAPGASAIVTVTPPVESRALTAGELACAAKKYVPDVTSAESTEQALELAFEKAKAKTVVICGSLYLAAEIRKLITEDK